MTTPTFKIGDRVRVARDTVYGAKKGAEFTITHISTPLKPEGAYACGEGFPGGVWLADLEPAEELESIRDRHIAHINGLDAVIRRRNAQIAEQVKIIDAQKAQLAEYAAQLEDSTHALDKTAYQLGLSSDDAVQALEIGARLLAHGFATPDVDRDVKNFLGAPVDELDAMLREFHGAFDVERNIYFYEYDIDPDLIKRQHFLQEEVNELLEAILKGDRVAAADALGDIIYIAAGTADLAGIPITKVLRAIHAANMRKLGPDGKPVPHATIPGKIGKPEGWTGPEADIEKILSGDAS